MKAHNIRHFKNIWLIQSIDLLQISFSFSEVILLVAQDWKFQNRLNVFVGQKWLFFSVWPNILPTNYFNRTHITPTNSMLSCLIMQVLKIIITYLKELLVTNRYFMLLHTDNNWTIFNIEDLIPDWWNLRIIQDNLY